MAFFFERVKKMAGWVFRSRICRHVLFWCLSYYYLLHFFLLGNEIGAIDYIYTLVFHLPLLAVVYLNLLVAIPGLLSRRKFLLYGLALLGLMGLAAGLNKFFFDYGIDYVAPGYFFVSDLSWGELLLFALVYMGLTTLVRLSRAWFGLQESGRRMVLLEKEKINAELAFLRSQINPHFLFNSLNNLYSLVLKKDGLAPAMLLKLAAVMRYMIYESDAAMVPLRKEAGYIADYIELQKLRVRDASRIRFETKGVMGDQPVAPLIFVVFIENAFKHGGGGDGGAADVSVLLEAGEGWLRLRVGNEKGIVDDVEGGSFKGLGIENVRRRLELIYADRYELSVEDGALRYVVDLVLND